MVRGVAALLLGLGIAGCDQTSTEATSIILQQHGEQLTSYSPASCKTNAGGMVYFALGNEVFRRPLEERMNIVSMSPSESAAAPPSPDPTDQQGCPLNPVIARSFNITYQFKPEHPERYSANTSFDVRQINFIGLNQEARKSKLEFVHWGNQPAHEREFARVKKEAPKTCERLANGLTSCLEPNAERPRQSWSAKFQAELAQYAAPFGRPFTVNCTAWLYMEKQDCNVEYNYTDDTRVAYKFELHELPAAEIIAFDKGLRSRIEAMRVADFQWGKAPQRVR